MSEATLAVMVPMCTDTQEQCPQDAVAALGQQRLMSLATLAVMVLMCRDTQEQPRCPQEVDTMWIVLKIEV